MHQKLRSFLAGWLPVSVILLWSGCQDPPTMSDELDRLRERIESEQIEDPPMYREEFDRFIVDRTPIVGDFIYQYTLRRLQGRSDKSISDLVAGEFSYDQAMASPDDFRGQVWRIHGTIEDIDSTPFKNSVSGTTDTVYMGYFLTKDHKPVAFHLAHKPEPLSIRVDQVQIEGVFIKLIDEKTKAGGTLTMPFFMAKRLRKYH